MCQALYHILENSWSQWGLAGETNNKKFKRRMTKIITFVWSAVAHVYISWEWGIAELDGSP